ncbi:unnamed protein product [Rangifer tarandus platyrhynchus]|uniref:Uncharacterized protein n=1 Tax=Rangifer tarandus platyrhynchus TaxID=3082113 RepID=A0AC59Z756_RANTA
MPVDTLGMCFMGLEVPTGAESIKPRYLLPVAQSSPGDPLLPQLQGPFSLSSCQASVFIPMGSLELHLTKATAFPPDHPPAPLTPQGGLWVISVCRVSGSGLTNCLTLTRR